MRKLSILAVSLLILSAHQVWAKQYVAVEYRPLNQVECIEKKDKLGLKHCPHDDDYLAGAVAACGGVDNMPTMKDLLALAKSLYKNVQIESNGTSMYGERDDKKMQELGIWVNDSHIYYWSNEEAKDGVGGYVRMFASRGSIPYYAPRDGSGYVSHALGKLIMATPNILEPEIPNMIQI